MRRKVLKFGAGYVLAVFVAVCVTELILVAPSIFPDEGRFGSFYVHLRDLPGLFVVGIIYTFGTALPGYATTLFLSHRNGSGSKLFYCTGGALTALSAHVILAGLMGGFVITPYIIFVCSVPGGMAGAFAYYVWQRKLTSFWAENSDITFA